MYKYLILILLFCVLGLPLFGQSEPVIPDSIDRVIKSIKGNNQLISYLLNIIEREQYQHPDLALALANEAYTRASVHSDKELEAKSAFWLAWTEFQQSKNGNHTHALSMVSLSVDLFHQTTDRAGLALALCAKAALVRDIKLDTVSAKVYLDEAKALIPKIQNAPHDSIWTLAYLYLVQSNLTDINKTGLQKESLRLFELTGDSIRVGRGCVKLAGTLTLNKDYEAAKGYALRARKAYQYAGYKKGEKDAFIKYIDVLLYQNQGKDVVSNTIIDAINIRDTANRNSYELLTRLGIVYAQSGKNATQLSMRKMLFDSAMHYFKEAWPLAQKVGNINDLHLISDNILRYCADFGDFGDCEKMSREFSDYYFSLLEQSNKKTVETQNQLSERYNEIRRSTLQEEEARRNRMLFIGLVIFAGLVLFFIYLNQQRNIKSLNQKLNSRMEALRAQMNPHFISNALNAIDSLVNQNRNKEASKYIIQFSRLCRIILNNSRNESISLGEELEMLKYFLNLEQLRMGDKLHYQIEADPLLNKDQIALPPMILQPFVENAIWHGIQPKTGDGLVTIRIQKWNDQFYQCIIEDNGIGRQKSAALKASMIVMRPSLGLAITEERIEKLYKLKGSNIQTEDLQQPDGTAAGTRVIITLPIQNVSIPTT